MPGVFSSKRNFLFDLDGTLVDSTAVHARAYVEALQSDHPNLARSFDYLLYAGQPTRQVFAALGLASGQVDELARQKQQLYRAALGRGEVELFPGVTELLTRLCQLDRKLFVVTGASRVSAELILDTADLAKFFTGVVAAEDTTEGKPSPAPYRYTLAAHGLATAESLAVEDGENGLRSAQAAGLDVALVYTNSKIDGVTSACDFSELSRLLLA